MKLPLLVLLATFLAPGPGPAVQGKAQEFESHGDALEPEFMYAERPKRAVDTAVPVAPAAATGAGAAASQTEKCSYTFIVPQQKATGAICVNSRSPEGQVDTRVNKQEVEVLNGELQKQRRQIESLQQLVEVDGGVVNEVKLLRKESRNMNARVTQLYMQLLHEIIRKRDNALEVAQLENRVLNHTTEMHQLVGRYRDLEHKYTHLASLASNQSAIIVQLEEHCRRTHGSGGERERERERPAPRARQPLPPQQQPPVMPQHPPQRPQSPMSPARPYHPPTYTRNSNNQLTNEIQSDQNAKALLQPMPTMPYGTQSSSSTDKPSGEFRDT